MEIIYLDMLFEVIGILKIKTETLGKCPNDVREQCLRLVMWFNTFVVGFVMKCKC